MQLSPPVAPSWPSRLKCRRQHDVVMAAIGDGLFARGHFPDALSIVTAAVAASRQELCAVRAEFERADVGSLEFAAWIAPCSAPWPTSLDCISLSVVG